MKALTITMTRAVFTVGLAITLGGCTTDRNLAGGGDADASPRIADGSPARGDASAVGADASGAGADASVSVADASPPDTSPPDASPPDAAPQPCEPGGPVGPIQDDFDDGVLASVWETSPAADGSIAETGGALRLDCGTSFSTVQSKTEWNPTGQTFLVEVASGGFPSFQIGNGYGQFIGIRVRSNDAYLFNGTPSFVSLDEIQRWLRIRNDGSSYHYETSADGKIWSQLGVASDPFVEHPLVHLQLMSIAYGDDAKGVVLDNLDLPPDCP